jgi:hypothetical protein
VWHHILKGPIVFVIPPSASAEKTSGTALLVEPSTQVTWAQTSIIESSTTVGGSLNSNSITVRKIENNH